MLLNEKYFSYQQNSNEKWSNGMSITLNDVLYLSDINEQLISATKKKNNKVEMLQLFSRIKSADW